MSISCSGGVSGIFAANEPNVNYPTLDRAREHRLLGVTVKSLVIELEPFNL
jgi:hypothetical protein